MKNTFKIIPFLTMPNFPFGKLDEPSFGAGVFNMQTSPICCIYKITSPVGSIYIGQTVNFHKRVLYYKNVKCIRQPKIYKSLLIYGFNAHTVEIIKECTREELNYWERYYIKFYDCFDTEHGLNLMLGGNGGPCAKESGEKISKAKKGKPNYKLRGIKRTLEQKQKLSLARKGKKMNLSEQQREAKRKYMMGKPGNNTGKKLSKEWKDKIIKNLLRVHTPETKAKVIASNKKRGCPDKVKQNIKQGHLDFHRLKYMENNPPICQLSLDGFLLNVFDTPYDAHLATGVNHYQIPRVLRGKLKTTGGFIWK